MIKSKLTLLELKIKMFETKIKKTKKAKMGKSQMCQQFPLQIY